MASDPRSDLPGDPGASGSIPFDRAAAYYDETRRIDPGALAATLRVLEEELSRRAPVLEIGVGTGVLATPLAERGVPVVGLDLSMPMLEVLRGKPGGDRVPLVRGDATRLPFRDAAFGGAYLRWVLHLIADWERAVAELVRAVRPGGVLVIEPGGYQGPWREVWLRFLAEVGEHALPIGFDARDVDALDRTMARLGGRRRELPEVRMTLTDTLEAFFESIEERRYSWTWRVTDADLDRALPRVRRWTEERFGDPTAVPAEDVPMLWRAYDLA